MAEIKEGQSIQEIKIGDTVHPIDAVTVDGKDINDYQLKEGLVVSINSSSDDEHYPSAKCMWDIVGDVENILSTI